MSDTIETIVLLVTLFLGLPLFLLWVRDRVSNARSRQRNPPERLADDRGPFVMKQPSREIDDVRPMSPAERELTRWMLDHSGAPDVERFLAHLERAHVISRCPCGCASVNFSVSGEAEPTGGLRVLGDYVFGDEETMSGAFVFEQNGVLAGLEVYGLGGDAPRTLPHPEELRPFRPGTA